MHTYVPHIHSSGHLPIARLQVNVSKQYLCTLHLSLTCIISCHISDILAVFWATYTRKRFPAFCIVSSNELVVLYSLENSKPNTKTQENVSVCTGPHALIDRRLIDRGNLLF